MNAIKPVLRSLTPRAAAKTSSSPSASPAPLFAEPTLFYDPPYERPLEDSFAWHLVKYLAPIVALDYGVRVETPLAPAWVDFVVAYERAGVPRRVGFVLGEIDPLDDPDPDQARQLDALVVGAGGLDVLYRIRGLDALHRLDDVLRLVAAWDPDLFTTRARVNLDTLASPGAREARLRADVAEIVLDYAEPEPLDFDEADALDADVWPAPASDLHLRRLDRSCPAAWTRDLEEALARFDDPDGDALSFKRSA